MKAHALLIAGCLCVATALAQDAEQTAVDKYGPTVEITADPTHHLKIDNPYIRAFYVEVAPQQSTLMHHHGKDYIAVAYGHGDVDSIRSDGTTKHVVLEDGDVLYTPAPLTHVAIDRAATPFRNATIELLQNDGHPVCVNKCQDDPRAKDWPPLPAGVKLIGYGDTFRIVGATIQPKQTVSGEQPFPHLTILLTDMQLHTGPPGSTGTDINRKAGDMIFHGPHPDNGLTNTGDQPLRLVVVEFKPVRE